MPMTMWRNGHAECSRRGNISSALWKAAAESKSLNIYENSLLCFIGGKQKRRRKSGDQLHPWHWHCLTCSHFPALCRSSFHNIPSTNTKNGEKLQAMNVQSKRKWSWRVGQGGASAYLSLDYGTKAWVEKQTSCWKCTLGSEVLLLPGCVCVGLNSSF